MFCVCLEFVFWYTTDSGIDVCHCGHADFDHIDKKGTCIGDVELL